MNLTISDIEKRKEEYANCAEDEIAYEKTQNCEIEQHTVPDGRDLKVGFKKKQTCENLGMYAAWVGGAILAKVVFLQNQHVAKADYDTRLDHRWKCFSSL